MIFITFRIIKHYEAVNIMCCILHKYCKYVCKPLQWMLMVSLYVLNAMPQCNWFIFSYPVKDMSFGGDVWKQQRIVIGFHRRCIRTAYHSHSMFRILQGSSVGMSWWIMGRQGKDMERPDIAHGEAGLRSWTAAAIIPNNRSLTTVKELPT
jgi:hypothetical protein